MNSFSNNGSSAYLLISRINHSCCPNCLAFSDDLKKYIRTITPITKGTEITISYIFLYYPYTER